jgi:hypothetical protein
LRRGLRRGRHGSEELLHIRVLRIFGLGLLAALTPHAFLLRANRSLAVTSQGNGRKFSDKLADFAFFSGLAASYGGTLSKPNPLHLVNPLFGEGWLAQANAVYAIYAPQHTTDLGQLFPKGNKSMSFLPWSG